MIDTLKDKLHLFAIRRRWYSTVYTGKTTIHKTIFGTFFKASNYMCTSLNRLIKSEVERSVTDAKDEFVEAYLREKEKADQLSELEIEQFWRQFKTLLS